MKDNQQYTESSRMQRTVRRLPGVIALLFGMLWALTYTFFGRLHDMWSMFDEEFPFLLPTALGIEKGNMTPLVGTFFAFADGSLIGFLWTRIFVLLAQRPWSNKKSALRLLLLTAALVITISASVSGCPP